MGARNRWLLPDGVDEVLPPRARQVEALRRRLLDVFERWGYDLVVPPVIEYLDSLLSGIGEDLAGRLLLLDALLMEWQTMRLRKNPRCPECGTPAA